MLLPKVIVGQPVKDEVFVTLCASAVINSDDLLILKKIMMLNEYDNTVLFLTPQAFLYTHQKVRALHHGNSPSLQSFRNS